MNLFKKLKLTYFFIFFIACSSPGSIDYEDTISNDDYCEWCENGRQVGSRPDQDTSNSIAPPSFLALGDSYTIGEGVNGDQRWPNQFVDIAYFNGVEIDQPIIISETGWKTYDLLNAIKQTNFTKKYDYISLLIGVNNQFNSRPIDEFEEDLEKLMDEMKRLKKNDGSITIISIPDWGSSPYGIGYDRNQISNEINLFNNSLKNFANIYGLKYVDVTEISRRAINEPNLIAGDNLHPSGVMYLEWAKKIFNVWIK